MLECVFEIEVAYWIVLFLFRMMFKVNSNRRVMSNSIPALSSFFPGHFHDLNTGQRDLAGIGHGNELQLGNCI